MPAEMIVQKVLPDEIENAFVSISNGNGSPIVLIKGLHPPGTSVNEPDFNRFMQAISDYIGMLAVNKAEPSSSGFRPIGTRLDALDSDSGTNSIWHTDECEVGWLFGKEGDRDINTYFVTTEDLLEQQPQLSVLFSGNLSGETEKEYRVFVKDRRGNARLVDSARGTYINPSESVKRSIVSAAYGALHTIFRTEKLDPSASVNIERGTLVAWDDERVLHCVRHVTERDSARLKEINATTTREILRGMINCKPGMTHLETFIESARQKGGDAISI